MVVPPRQLADGGKGEARSPKMLDTHFVRFRFRRGPKRWVKAMRVEHRTMGREKEEGGDKNAAVWEMEERERVVGRPKNNLSADDDRQVGEKSAPTSAVDQKSCPSPSPGEKEEEKRQRKTLSRLIDSSVLLLLLAILKRRKKLFLESGQKKDSCLRFSDS